MKLALQICIPFFFITRVSACGDCVNSIIDLYLPFFFPGIILVLWSLYHSSMTHWLDFKVVWGLPSLVGLALLILSNGSVFAFILPLVTASFIRIIVSTVRKTYKYESERNYATLVLAIFIMLTIVWWSSDSRFIIHMRGNAHTPNSPVYYYSDSYFDYQYASYSRLSSMEIKSYQNRLEFHNHLSYLLGRNYSFSNSELGDLLEKILSKPTTNYYLIGLILDHNEFHKSPIAEGESNISSVKVGHHFPVPHLLFSHYICKYTFPVSQYSDSSIA